MQPLSNHQPFSLVNTFNTISPKNELVTFGTQIGVQRRSNTVLSHCRTLGEEMWVLGNPKNAGAIHIMFGGQFSVSQRARNTGCSALWQIFSSYKVCQRIGRKDSIQTACRRMIRLKAVWYLAAHYFKLFSIIQNLNLKI
jgi:hypothetical protein